MKYNKLVRDNIVDIILENGETPIFKKLDDKEYLLELKKKLQEEALEVFNANNDEILEELADILEIITNIALENNYSLDDIVNKSKEKNKQKGSFVKKIYLEEVL